MGLILSRRSGRGRERADDRPRYVSGIQSDVQRYEGWSRSDVESDYRAKKNVRTIVTLGYMEYVDEILVITEKGGLLMQNVESPAPADGRRACRAR